MLNATHTLPAAKFTSFIANDEQAIWGVGQTLAECKADARDYRDDNLDGLDFYKATDKAREAVEARGPDAWGVLVFGAHRECWHVSESDHRDDE